MTYIIETGSSEERIGASPTAAVKAVRQGASRSKRLLSVIADASSLGRVSIQAVIGVDVDGDYDEVTLIWRRQVMSASTNKITC